MLAGCTTTCTWSISTPNSQRASMTSNPLLTMVEESMVSLCPMDQLGCFNASSSRTFSSCSLVNPRNGPPEAVSSIL